MAKSLGIPTAKPKFTREMEFSLLMILINKISDDDKLTQVVELLNNHKDLLLNFSSVFVSNDKGSDEENDESLDLLFKDNPLVSTSTPKKPSSSNSGSLSGKKRKHCLMIPNQLRYKRQFSISAAIVYQVETNENVSRLTPKPMVKINLNSF